MLLVNRQKTLDNLILDNCPGVTPEPTLLPSITEGYCCDVCQVARIHDML